MNVDEFLASLPQPVEPTPAEREATIEQAVDALNNLSLIDWVEVFERLGAEDVLQDWMFPA